MGTRHVIAVQLNGEYKVAQYGQWDGYPSGQGVEVLAFLRTVDLDTFAKKVSATQWLTDEEAKAGWVECGAKPEEKFVGMDISDVHSQRYPERSRDTGSDILKIVNDRPEGIKLRNSISFAADSLMCEYVYVIDLDTKKLEVFRGFNHSPLDPAERFAAMLPEEDQGHRSEKYYPVKKVVSFDLSALPSDEDFLKVADPQEEEEAA